MSQTKFGLAGEPMLFDKGTKGLAFDAERLAFTVVDVVDGDWQAAGVRVHDVKNRVMAHMLAELPFDPFPMPLGVLYDDPAPTYESAVIAEREASVSGKEANLAKLLSGGQTWTVDGSAQDPV